MYTYLKNITKRPELFKEYTAKELWADKHISKQMLQFHLDGENDIASRSSTKIEKIITFIVDRLKITKKTNIIDYGCGPGLYTQRLAMIGARATGIDFSPNSIAYAKETAQKSGLNINYIVADYLIYRPQDKFDLALLIYYDLCALSPIQRKMLLANIHSSLNDDGILVLDVLSLFAFNKRSATIRLEQNLMNGFWSSFDYFGIMQTFIYRDKNVVLDRYDIIEQDRTKIIYNWLEYYDLEKIATELKASGFKVESYYSELSEEKFDKSSDEIFIVAKKA